MSRPPKPVPNRLKLRRYAAVFADQAVVSVVNVLTGVIIARVCSKEELGLYMAGFSVVLFFLSIQTALVSTPYMVLSPRLNVEDHAYFTGSALLLQLTLAVCTSAALAIFFFVLNAMGRTDLTPISTVLTLSLTFILFREFARRVLFSNLRIEAAFVLDVVVACVQLGGLGLLVHFGSLRAATTYAIIGLACGLSGLLWLIAMHTRIRLSLKRVLSDLAQNWRFGRWIFASGLLWAISADLYPWIIAMSHGTAGVGVWASCMFIVGLSNPVMLAVQNLIGPRIAHAYAGCGTAGLTRQVLNGVGLSALVMLPLVILLVSKGGWLVEFVYGAEYAGNGLLVTLLGCTFFVFAVAYSFPQGLFALGRPDVDFLANIAAIIVLITAGVWLVKAYGSLGAGIALLITHLASLLVKSVGYAVLTRQHVVEAPQ